MVSTNKKKKKKEKRLRFDHVLHCNSSLEKKKKTRRRRRMRKEVHLLGVSYLVRGERLARLINTSAKGWCLQSSEASEHGVVLSGA